jgi:festuclavine dehydrogenase
MAILLTGGTGKTSTRIARLCLDAKVSFVIASRQGQAISSENYPAVKFDWMDSATFANPFEHKFPDDEKIDKVYLVAPEAPDPAAVMGPFINLAKEHGVKKFVYFTGSTAELEGPFAGKVWKKLDESGVEYTVLRATWLMGEFESSESCEALLIRILDNFLLWQHGATIKNENAIYSACGDGAICFISANDIARMAFFLLTDSKPHETNYRLLGPELLTFDQVAEKISQGIGRAVKHVKISEQESYDRFVKFGLPAHLAKFVASREVETANGAESFVGNDVEKVTGKSPEKFETWVVDNIAGFEN